GASSLEALLHDLTVNDAKLVYQAIRLTQPGGMGKVTSQDVSDEPTITLLEAMGLAAERDLIAKQYVTGYRDIWEVLLPTLEKALQGLVSVSTHNPWHPVSPSSPREWGIHDAIQHTFLVSLATLGDSLIARKCGPAMAGEAQVRAQAVLAGQQTMEELDAWLRADGHRRNPGTTADLLCATLFLALVRGTLLACFP
ncbi:MAG TPA: triphosphoribosyl-dephospho-CoA synthase, partial [Gemmatales bacterium]|nr:triphosphoribosyl-dephospho-CoA synthase [Gemmatales bacterium]